MTIRTARILINLIGCFLVCLLVASCSSPARNETSPADISEVRLGSLQPPPLRVRVTAYGVLANSCERLGGVTQRLEGRTFFIEITKLSLSESAECAAVITEFREEVVLELQGLADGVYTVDVNGVVETFELKGGGIFVKSLRAFVDTVDVQVLEASPQLPAVRIGVALEGKFGDPCVDLLGVTEMLEGEVFKLTLETTERIDVACPPVTELFREFVLLEPQNLTPGSYRVVVEGVDTMSTSFVLESDSSYGEAEVTDVAVVLGPSFTANVTVRGVLQGACEVIDGAVQQQEGTDGDAPPNREFVISLISRTTGTCSGKTVSFEEVIPISSYSSGDQTVSVNGVVERFAFPDDGTFTLP